MKDEDKEKKITILINNKPYEAPKPAMTSAYAKNIFVAPAGIEPASSESPAFARICSGR